MKNINELINFIQKELEKIQIQTEQESQKLNSLPSPNDIRLKDYGTKKNLMEKYFGDKKRFTKLLIYFAKENKLKQKIVDNKSNHITQQIAKLNSKQKKYLELIEYLRQNQKLPEIYPNGELLKLLFGYASNNAINPQTFISFLMIYFSKCINNSSSSDLLYEMEKNLIEFFENGELKKDKNYDALIFTFNNFLKELFPNKIDQDLKIYCELLKLYIKSISLKPNDKKYFETKKELDSRQEALAIIRKYLKNHKIIKICEDTNYFANKLTEAGFDNKAIREILIAMKERIKTQKIKEENQKIKKIIQERTTENSYNIIKEAQKVIVSKTNILHDLIKKKYDDIVSLCTYISIEDEKAFPDNSELLSEKILELEMILKVAKEEKEEKTPNYFYLNDDHTDLYFAKDLECLDILTHPQIFEILNSLLSNDLEPKPYKKIKNNIQISNIGDGLKIYIASKNGLNFIIAVSNEFEQDLIDRRIDSLSFQDDINLALKKAIEDPLFLKKQAKYNKIIINILNPKNSVDFTLKF